MDTFPVIKIRIEDKRKLMVIFTEDRLGSWWQCAFHSNSNVQPNAG